MARTTLSHPFDTMSGKLTHNDKIILRTRNGNTHAYAIRNPYKGPVAPERQRTLDAFASAVAQGQDHPQRPRFACGLATAFRRLHRSCQPLSVLPPKTMHHPSRLHHLHSYPRSPRLRHHNFAR